MISNQDTQKKWRELAEKYSEQRYGHKKHIQAIQLGQALAILQEEQVLRMIETLETWIVEDSNV